MIDLTGSRKLVLLVCLLIAAILAAGCTAAARKPETNTNRNPVAQENKQAQKLAREATRVEGVKSAYVVVSGNMAVVGLDINKGIESTETNRIKSEVGRRLKNADRQINDVRVSTDADTVTRIRKISEGISQGRPLTDFTKQLNEIVRRIAPTKE
ncbi:YhcN/YlaJ family sporulation lipoprotein [Desulforamulus putei]|uniref:YhcN/YlaJ family sporulation lipoprotein n=1 Tax=Desulforamulus putei TaxID=74701 RepID=UPI001EE48B37|nr:YhcN/YlaJ family sporulation lipoprotein [Desulforamulus putei]